MKQKEHKKTIFLSYSSFDSDLADVIEKGLYGQLNDKVRISRFTRDVKYRESFLEFMNTLNSHDFVIAIVSDHYIKSRACMYEMGKVIGETNFKRKLLFVVVTEQDADLYKTPPSESFAADVYSLEGRNSYFVYWDQKLESLKKATKKIANPIAKVEAYKNENETRQIIEKDLPPFLQYISDARAIPLKEFLDSKFNIWCQIICANSTSTTPAKICLAMDEFGSPVARVIYGGFDSLLTICCLILQNAAQEHYNIKIQELFLHSLLKYHAIIDESPCLSLNFSYAPLETLKNSSAVYKLFINFETDGLGQLNHDDFICCKEDFPLIFAMILSQINLLLKFDDVSEQAFLESLLEIALFIGSEDFNASL